jgi:hypothetical protein
MAEAPEKGFYVKPIDKIVISVQHIDLTSIPAHFPEKSNGG